MYATRFGIGVSPDSTFYISAAEYFYNHGEIRSIFEGSKWEYMTHYPPGYSIALSVVNLFTNDIYQAARWYNAFFLFSLIFLIGIITKPFFSLVGVIFSQLIILCNVSFFSIYQMAWSESAYLFFSFLGLYLLYLYVKKTKKNLLIASAITISAAITIRYVGIVLIAVSSIYLFLSLYKQRNLKCVGIILLHGVLASSSMIFWIIRNYILVNNPTDRHLSFHPMPIEYYENWLKTTSDFFMPFTLEGIAAYILGGILFLGLTLSSIFIIKKTPSSIISLLVIYANAYLLLLFTSNTFFDDTPLYYRTLSPAYFAFIIALLLWIFNRTTKHLNTLVFFLAIINLFFMKEFNFHIRKIDDGIDYSSRHFKVPSTIKAIVNIPQQIKVYTNEVDRFYYLSNGRISDWLTDLDINNDDNYVVVLFKNGRNYNSRYWIESKVKWKIITESEDVSIRKKSSKD